MKMREEADMKISLDLDEGVKVNCGQFGELLTELNTIAAQD